MDGLIFTFSLLIVVAGGFLAWTYTKRGKKWLENL